MVSLSTKSDAPNAFLTTPQAIVEFWCLNQSTTISVPLQSAKIHYFSDIHPVVRKKGIEEMITNFPVVPKQGTERIKVMISTSL